MHASIIHACVLVVLLLLFVYLFALCTYIDEFHFFILYFGAVSIPTLDFSTCIEFCK